MLYSVSNTATEWVQGMQEHLYTVEVARYNVAMNKYNMYNVYMYMYVFMYMYNVIMLYNVHNVHVQSTAHWVTSIFTSRPV